MTIQSPASPTSSRSSQGFFLRAAALHRIVWGALIIATLLASATGVRAAWALVQTTTDAAPLASAVKLAAGTIELNSTAQGVDADTARRLLPLWRLLAQTTEGGAASPDEITAIVDQIQLNMSAAQIRAIETMPLPPVDRSVPSSSTQAPAIIQQVIDELLSKAQS